MRTSPTHGEGGREWGNPWGEPALGAASKLRGLSMGEAASPRQLPLHEEACGQSQHRATAGRHPGNLEQDMPLARKLSKQAALLACSPAKQRTLFPSPVPCPG